MSNEWMSVQTCLCLCVHFLFTCKEMFIFICSMFISVYTAVSLSGCTYGHISHQLRTRKQLLWREKYHDKMKANADLLNYALSGANNCQLKD